MKGKLKCAILYLFMLCTFFSIAIPVQAKTKISQKTATILVSDTLKLSVKGTNKKVKWSSSNKKVAKVNSKGKVTGVKAGKATIKATVGKKTYSCKVTVKAGISPKTISMYVDDIVKIRLYGTEISTCSYNRKITLSSIKKKTITIHALKAGTCTLKIKAKNGKKYTCKITIKEAVKPTEPASQPSTEPTPQPSTEPAPQPSTEPTPEEYTVTFNSNGGSAVASQRVKSGEQAKIPDTPEKDGYTFVGWYSDAALQNSFTFATAITCNITLYAKWDEKIPTTYTRGEWIGLLANMVDMNLDVDPNNIDYYFGDTEGTEYAIAIETAYAYGILPAADVEDLEQDVASFYPYEVATRDFAAYTVIAAMGFEGNYTADTSYWQDWDEIAYKPQAAIAVSFGFMELSGGNYFRPQDALIDSEIELIKNAMDKVNASVEVKDEDIHDDSVYLDSVVKDELSAITGYTVVNNGEEYTVKVGNDVGLAAIQEGGVVVLPATDSYPTGLALKVVSVSVGAEQTILTGTAPELEEVYSKIDVAGTATALVDQITAAEGVEMSYDPGMAAYARIGGSTSLPGLLKYETGQIKLGSTVYAEGSIVIGIPDITCVLDADFNPFSGMTVNEFLFSITEEVQISGTMTLIDANTGLEVTEGDNAFQLASNSASLMSGRRELGRVPFAIGTSGMSVDVVFFYQATAKGTISVGYTLDMTQGFQYKDGSSRAIMNFRDSLTAIELKASGTAGVGIAVDLCAFRLMDVVGYYIEGGLGIDASFTAHVIATDPLYCSDAIVYAYLKHGIVEGTVVGKILKALDLKVEFEPLQNNDSNPYRLKIHIENGKRVSECTFGVGELKGYVQDADTRSCLGNAKIQLYNEENVLIRTKFSEADGGYSIDNLTAGNYKIVISATGYYKYETTVEVKKDETAYLESALMVDRDNKETGIISGNILDATTGYGISGASYEIRSGGNNLTGEVIESGIFDSTYYELTLSVGYYTLAVKKDGYVTNSINISISSGERANQNIVLSPEREADGNLRIVLTWGEYPWDLDSHLFGPSTDDGSRFHTCYYDDYAYNAAGTVIADLDVDDTSSYGPETTTVRQMAAEGIYSFYVHDYTNRSASYSTEMSNSGAKVQVYLGDTLCYTFNVPVNVEGTLWHVFDYDVETDRLTPVNSFSYVSDPGAIYYSLREEVTLEMMDSSVFSELPLKENLDASEEETEELPEETEDLPEETEGLTKETEELPEETEELMKETEKLLRETEESAEPVDLSGQNEPVDLEDTIEADEKQTEYIDYIILDIEDENDDIFVSEKIMKSIEEDDIPEADMDIVEADLIIE